MLDYNDSVGHKECRTLNDSVSKNKYNVITDMYVKEVKTDILVDKNVTITFGLPAIGSHFKLIFDRCPSGVMFWSMHVASTLRRNSFLYQPDMLFTRVLNKQVSSFVRKCQ